MLWSRFLRPATIQQGFWYFTRSQSRKFQVNPWNPAKFRKTCEIPRNSLEILPNPCWHIIFESYLGCWGSLLTVNLLIYLKLRPHRVNNIPKLPGVLRLMLRKTGKQRCKNPGIPSVDCGNWGWEWDSLFYAAFCKSVRLVRSSHLQRWRSFSERFGPQMIMPENLQNERSSCSFSRDNK